ncbi:exocyst complex component 3-like protein 2 [Orycteropus afer afer]|uniref:Exocyst complex component 3-like protein 2 n=1 Tax=Orycteropus afer afer TaxID=1230840 RepID=A0A8B7A155_ORYAF|nr:exocyst complex component 3-like protein 2 [Orycteropus afer afer]
MPVLKSLGVADSKVPRAGTLPLRTSRNPFEEAPGLTEDEVGELGTLPMGASCRRRATLEKLAGLAPFRLGWAPGKRAGSPVDGQPRSFLGRVLGPGFRRSSADFGLLARLQGIRPQGEDEVTGETARRLAFLRLGRGPKPRRASLAERVVPAGEAAPEPPPKVSEPPKMKEPLSVLEILSLIQQRELARADEHILELEAEELASSGGGAPGPPKAEGAGGGRRARDVALLYEALQPPAYPAGLGAFGVYLRGYHGALADWLGAAARRRLPLADRYALLHWHNQVYPREVLGLVDMVALENGELGPLLSPGTLRGLEDECVTDVKAQTRAALLRVLQEDEERWGAIEDQPGSLAQDVCELLEEHTERAPRISQEFGERMAHCCLGGLAEFLQSFQQRVERFHENPGVRELPPDTYISRTIALVNCGPPLRTLAERLARVGPPESEPAREAAASALARVTRLCHRVLADLLFQELQPHFNKLMRRKWLSSPEALDGIVGTLGAQALALRRMQDEPYQALVAELHRRALVEYVRPLLRGRLRCRSARTRSRVAGRLREDSAQLQRLFRRLESQASWLDAVVPHLAEVLQLEDTPSIQVEVGVLVRDYPDIRQKHVAALLDIRGLRNAAARHEILAVARDLELSEGVALATPRDRAFFADIPVPRPPFCLGLPLLLGRLPLSRLSRPRLACLPRPRPPSLPRPRAQL